jgi:dual specificity MAP kinase phosphatase
MARTFPTRHWLFVGRSHLWAWVRSLRRRLAGTLPPNVNDITDQLYVGGFIDAHDWAALNELGVTVDVNLQAERHDHFAAHNPENYLWLPTMDHTAPDLDAMDRGVAYVQRALRNGDKILIHCHAGMGRSALLCAAVLVAEGHSADEAWAIVKARRPIAHLHREQRAALKAFASRWASHKEPAL